MAHKQPRHTALPALNFWWYLVGISALYCLIADVPEFCRLPLKGAADAAFMVCYFAFVALTQAALLALLAISRWVFAITFPLLLTLTAALAYFYITMNITVSGIIVGLVIHNDFATSSDYLTAPLLLTIAGALCFAALCVVARWRYVRPLTPKTAIATAVAAIAIIAAIYSVQRITNMIEIRAPYSIVRAVREYADEYRAINTVRPAFDHISAATDADSLTVVVILGETWRPDRLALNGYHRNTTPLLASVANLVSYPNISTSATYTGASIPRIMTRADDANPDIAYDEPSFISLFKKAGFATAWLANQNTEASFAYFTQEADTVVNVAAGHSEYMYDRWYDDELLPPYQQRLEHQGNNLIVLHTIGSHWWYKAHYRPEDAKWLPELSSRNIGQCSPQEISNSYDNNSLATDRFVYTVIQALQGRNAVVVYVSDHGEALGENGVYLHAQPSPYNEQVATIIAWTDDFAANYPDKVQALKDNQQRRTDTGFVFHTVLDLAGIDTPVADRARSLASAQ